DGGKPAKKENFSAHARSSPRWSRRSGEASRAWQIRESGSASPRTTPPSRWRQQPHPLGQDPSTCDGGRAEHARQEGLANLAGLEVDARTDDGAGGEGGGMALQGGED